jgi:hypothetical protein
VLLEEGMGDGISELISKRWEQFMMMVAAGAFVGGSLWAEQAGID